LQRSFNHNLQTTDNTLIIYCKQNPPPLTIKIDETRVSAIANIDGKDYTFKVPRMDQKNKYYIFQIAQSTSSEYSQLIITQNGIIYLVGNKVNNTGKVQTLQLTISDETCGWASPKKSRNNSAAKKAPEIPKELPKELPIAEAIFQILEKSYQVVKNEQNEIILSHKNSPILSITTGESPKLYLIPESNLELSYQGFHDDCFIFKNNQTNIEIWICNSGEIIFKQTGTNIERSFTHQTISQLLNMQLFYFTFSDIYKLLHHRFFQNGFWNSTLKITEDVHQKCCLFEFENINQSREFKLQITYDPIEKQYNYYVILPGSYKLNTWELFKDRNNPNEYITNKNHDHEYKIDLLTKKIFKINTSENKNHNGTFELEWSEERYYHWENISQTEEDAPASNFSSFRRNLSEQWTPFSGRQILNNNVFSNRRSNSSQVIPKSRKRLRNQENDNNDENYKNMPKLIPINQNFTTIAPSQLVPILQQSNEPIRVKNIILNPENISELFKRFVLFKGIDPKSPFDKLFKMNNKGNPVLHIEFSGVPYRLTWNNSTKLIKINSSNKKTSKIENVTNQLKLKDFIKQESRPNVNKNSKKKFVEVLVELLKKSEKTNNNTLQLVPINPNLLQSVKDISNNLPKLSKNLNQPPLNITAQLSPNLFIIPYGETSIVVAKESDKLFPVPLLYHEGAYFCKLGELSLKIKIEGNNNIIELKNKDGRNVPINPELIGYNNSELKKSKLLYPINIQQESQNNKILEKSKEILKKIKEKYFGNSNTDNNRIKFKNSQGIIILSIEIIEDSILNLTSEQISGKLIENSNQKPILYKFKNDRRFRFTINTQNFEIYKIDLDEKTYKLVQYPNNIFNWELLKDNKKETSKTVKINNIPSSSQISKLTPKINLTNTLQKISPQKTQSRSILPSLQNQLRTMQSQIPPINPQSSLQNTELIDKISENIMVIRRLNRYYVVFIYNGQQYEHELIETNNLLYCNNCSIQIQGEEKSFNFAYNLPTKKYKIESIVQKRISNSRKKKIENFTNKLVELKNEPVQKGNTNLQLILYSNQQPSQFKINERLVESKLSQNKDYGVLQDFPETSLQIAKNIFIVPFPDHKTNYLVVPQTNEETQIFPFQKDPTTEEIYCEFTFGDETYTIFYIGKNKNGVILFDAKNKNGRTITMNRKRTGYNVKNISKEIAPNSSVRQTEILFNSQQNAPNTYKNIRNIRKSVKPVVNTILKGVRSKLEEKLMQQQQQKTIISLNTNIKSRINKIFKNDAHKISQNINHYKEYKKEIKELFDRLSENKKEEYRKKIINFEKEILNSIIKDKQNSELQEFIQKEHEEIYNKCFKKDEYNILKIIVDPKLTINFINGQYWLYTTNFGGQVYSAQFTKNGSILSIIIDGDKIDYDLFRCKEEGYNPFKKFYKNSQHQQQRLNSLPVNNHINSREQEQLQTNANITYENFIKLKSEINKLQNNSINSIDKFEAKIISNYMFALSHNPTKSNELENEYNIIINKYEKLKLEKLHNKLLSKEPSLNLNRNSNKKLLNELEKQYNLLTVNEQKNDKYKKIKYTINRVKNAFTNDISRVKTNPVKIQKQDKSLFKRAIDLFSPS
jgi:hypothetical protein